MTDPNQRRRSLGGDAATPSSGSGGIDSYLKARTALTVYQAQERQLAIEKKKAAQIAAEAKKHQARPRLLNSLWRGLNVPCDDMLI